MNSEDEGAGCSKRGPLQTGRNRFFKLAASQKVVEGGEGDQGRDGHEAGEEVHGPACEILKKFRKK